MANKAIEMIEGIAADVKDIKQQLSEDTVKNDVRINISSSERRTEMLRALSEMGEATAEEIKEHLNVEYDVTRTLTRFYETHIVNRRKIDGRYAYKLTDLGRNQLKIVNQQSKLDSVCDNDDTKKEEEETEEPDPWENTDLSESQYKALKAISEFDGRPTSEQANERYLEHGYPESENGTAISRRLSELFHDHGYVGRPPERPYVYWLTSEGREALND